MSDRRHPNGDYASPVAARPALRLTPVPGNMPQDAATRTLAEHSQAFLLRLNAMDEDLVKLGIATMEGFVKLEQRMGLPPMRSESPSSHDLIESVTTQLEARYRSVAAETTGPNVVATPEELSRIAQVVFAEETRKLDEKRKLERLQRDEEDRNTRAAKGLEDRRQLRVLTISGIIVALVTIAATYFVTKATTHDAAFIEGVKSVPAASATGR